MSNSDNWLAKNLSLGGLVSNIGAGIGTVTSAVASGIGSVASYCTNDKSQQKYLKDTCDSAGSTIDESLTKGSGVVGDFINDAINTVGDIVGSVSASAAQSLGATKENVDLTRKVGKVVGAASVGLAAGVGIANAAVAASAAAGTAGAAATTSGLAALGGGSVAAGGGGMAVGQAITQGIIAAGTASGLASVKDKKK